MDEGEGDDSDIENAHVDELDDGESTQIITQPRKPRVFKEVECHGCMAVFPREARLKDHLLKSINCMDVMGGDWTTARKTIKRLKSKKSYEDNASNKREERIGRYWGNVSVERSDRRRRYAENIEYERQVRRERYRSEGMRRFAHSGRYGPSYACLVCHELNWQEAVEVVERMTEIGRNYICSDYIMANKGLFCKQGVYFVCQRCKREIDTGVLPKLAAKNHLLCPWANVPEEFLSLTSVEHHHILAPNVIMAQLHNQEELVTGRKKLVSIPIIVDSENDIYRTIVNSSTSPDNIILRSNLNAGNIYVDIRMSLLERAHRELSANPSSPYKAYSGKDQNQSEKMSAAFALSRLDDVQVRTCTRQPGQSIVDLGSDPVVGNRTPPPLLNTVLLPDGKSLPRSFGFPVSFLLMKHPYVTSLPMYFPDSKGGLHDPEREFELSEQDFVLHYLRYVKKDLQENPMFSSIASLRLESNKLHSCFTALRGYNQNQDNEAELDENHKLRLMRHVGSEDYYMKQRLDIKAKSSVLGAPQIFYTFSCSNQWDVTLASILMQEGFDISHVDSEADKEYLYDAFPEKEYLIHVPVIHDSNCPSHSNCRRSFVLEFLEGDVEMKENLLNRNLYTINRIFQQRSRSVVDNVMRCVESGMGVEGFHDIKEFSHGFPHVHGVAWRKLDGSSEVVFHKLHERIPITENEYQVVTNLADTIMCVSTDPANIHRAFPNLSVASCDLIARLAFKHQSHTCTNRCERDKEGICWFKYPQEPTVVTLVAFPPCELSDNVAKNLVNQADAIKDAAKDVLRQITVNNEINTTDLETLLDISLGNIVELEGGSYEWKGGVFPSIPGANRHSVTVWKRFLSLLYNRSEDAVLTLAVYHTALSVSHNSDYHILLQRSVADTWIVEYNPHCLEAMKSNMSVRLITHTPSNVFDYITKGNRKPLSEKKIVMKLCEMSDQGVSGAHEIANRAEKMTEICQSEMFFRLDKQLHLSHTNITVAWIDSRFPHKRGATYERVDDVGEGNELVLPLRPGEYIRTSRIDDKFQKKPPILKLLTVAQMQSEFRSAKPIERLRLRGTAPSFPANRFILVSHLNQDVMENDRRLPSHIELEGGELMILMKASARRVINYGHHRSNHEKMYADMLIFLPWDNEEDFLGDACRSKEACEAMWEEYEEAVYSVKRQLNRLVTEALLS